MRKQKVSFNFNEDLFGKEIQDYLARYLWWSWRTKLFSYFTRVS